MWIAIAVVLTLVVAAVGYLASLPGDYRVSRSLEVEAPLERAFEAIVDFTTWPDWSPWLMHEPDARLEYSDSPQQEGGYYTWDGKRIGAGRLTHLEFRPGRRIQQEIEFYRPFKSVSEVNWEFESAGDNTRVSWEMIGHMPFLLRFMTRRMEPMIGRDYELGLALLNGFLNPKAEHPRLAFCGEEQLDDFSYWAVPFRGNLRQLETTRKSGIEALQSAAGGKAGVPLALYRGLDPMAADYQAEIALPIADQTPRSKYTKRSFSGGRYFKLVQHGPHRFLPLGWYALFSHCKMHGVRHDSARPALEIYYDDPEQSTDINAVQTALYLPIR